MATFMATVEHILIIIGIEIYQPSECSVDVLVYIM
jgi:hypothetical protein